MTLRRFADSSEGTDVLNFYVYLLVTDIILAHKINDPIHNKATNVLHILELLTEILGLKSLLTFVTLQME